MFTSRRSRCGLLGKIHHEGCRLSPASSVEHRRLIKEYAEVCHPIDAGPPRSASCGKNRAKADLTSANGGLHTDDAGFLALLRIHVESLRAKLDGSGPVFTCTCEPAFRCTTSGTALRATRRFMSLHLRLAIGHAPRSARCVSIALLAVAVDEISRISAPHFLQQTRK